jgi:hypothetical protein
MSTIVCRSSRIVTALALLASVTHAASVVTIQTAGSGYQILRNGSPYFVKGVGGQYRFAELASSGGNSVRTWGTNDWILDSAQAAGLTVTMGIWEPATAVAAVNKYKSHDALLMWGLGNEMETRTSDAVQLWKDVNAVALQMKAADPNHPVMTVVAEISATKIQQIKDNYPALDILGINSYGGITSLASRLASAGWTKPYMVTEFGPLGHWEVGKTAWGVPIEQTSTQKADFYQQGYAISIKDKPTCLGSYAFLWGFKQEKTHTWYGMFLQDDLGGGRTGAVDAMTYCWTGSWPATRCPTIAASVITVDTSYSRGNGSKHFAPGSSILCRVNASDPQAGPLTITWDLRKDVTLNPSSGGASEPANPPIANAVLLSGSDSAIIALPAVDGYYRVHVYVYNQNRGAATANLPIVVDSTLLAVKRGVSHRESHDGKRIVMAGTRQYDLAGRAVRETPPIGSVAKRIVKSRD